MWNLKSINQESFFELVDKHGLTLELLNQYILTIHWKNMVKKQDVDPDWETSLVKAIRLDVGDMGIVDADFFDKHLSRIRWSYYSGMSFGLKAKPVVPGFRRFKAPISQ